MSDSDKADQGKGFLARWSQRKQEAKQPEPKQDAPAVASDVPPGQVVEAEAEPEFDLSSLPKLEELTGTTDITAFLRKGVPEHLRNAALRKAWALDPAIRNYVNPALEYAYDWNTPGGVPGSGEIGAGLDVARLVSQIMGGESADPDATAGNEAAAAQSSERDPSPIRQQDHLPVESVRQSREAAAPEGDNMPQAAESDTPKPVAPQQPLRRHGTAKPIV